MVRLLKRFILSIKFNSMPSGAIGKVKIDESVKPVHFKERTGPALAIGAPYFVSFGGNITYPCVLTNIIISDGYPDRVEIEVPIKPRSDKGFTDVDGTVSHKWVSKHALYADEIGQTREEAVINEVAF